MLIPYPKWAGLDLVPTEYFLGYKFIGEAFSIMKSIKYDMRF